VINPILNYKHAVQSIQRDCRIAEIQRNIEKRQQKYDDLASGLQEVEIIETEAVLADGEKVVLFQLNSAGFAVTEADLATKSITREQVCRMLVEENGMA
jgi:hypothetical protein